MRATSEAGVSGEKERSCTFCDIVQEKLPVSKIEETDKIIVFASLSGYPLIAPKKHVDNVFDERLDKEVVHELAEMEVRVARAVRSAFSVDAVNIISANGKAAGQQVNHYHIHIMPRTANDNQIKLGKEVILPRPELDLRADLVKTRLNEQLPPHV
ncbi:MAG: hypothetical protein A3D74_04765 [Candidatus Levybacteria bacterium RIFCSPHIGHO2_02_FULL_37_13]|nr:MAG: hypothetical protein A3D74_04765 [Candidatus Levybacteria bacterium RIFCSPHIGHO2_02_FULL_37_13]OGH29442.1 MAG: hypothetical protein A3E40_01805 [Candidatus Levybacteria bacterium RIFCSPHIGHO2_12_FULL_37_9]OGH39433.1 MAG: hypothetical protein A3B41_02480 [Candidatus Levybacteria bacterium RIFCSPLOWO2_01_FULL_37_26]